MGPTYKRRKGKEDRGWEWEGSERKKGQGREKGEGGREGGVCGRGQKGGKGNGQDKSPTWSSQDLGSTVEAIIPSMRNRDKAPVGDLKHLVKERSQVK